MPRSDMVDTIKPPNSFDYNMSTTLLGGEPHKCKSCIFQYPREKKHKTLEDAGVEATCMCII